MAQLTFVSLYSGCGGLDLGFARAGFRPVWANDIDQDAVDTYNRIHKVEDPDWADAASLFVGHQAIQGDVRARALELTAGAADLVIGGPPCQGFSVAGRMDPDDPRSKHVFDFLGTVARVQPKAFVMENVKALAANRRWADVLEALRRRMGHAYDVEAVVLNASHWGVPQRRERMFLVGLPLGTGKFTMPKPATLDEPPSARSVITKLPPAGHYGNNSLCTAAITLAKKPVLRVSPFAGMLFNGQGRPIDLDKPAPTLPATMGGNRTPIIDEDQLLGERPWVEEYHRRLFIDREPPLRTLPDHVRMRRLTVEEAAALQTFPRDLDWQGRRNARFRQIGNAVPPVLAWHVGQAVMAALVGAHQPSAS
jgi:DNA (cytosine-5)-methyltransferase 1